MTALHRPLDLSVRDTAILQDLARVRLLTGRQIERLYFASLATANARGSDRRRTMRRLVDQRLVTTLPRRVGGERAGSAGLVYTLDARAYRVAERWSSDGEQSSARTRRPWAIGWQFVAHSLDVSELYVRLRERERTGAVRLARFDGEPASWFHGLKPDAFAVYETKQWEEHHWIEVDRATESLPTLTRKFALYLSVASSAIPHPAGVPPDVLVTVPSARRLDAVQQLIAKLPAPASALISVHLFAELFVDPARAPP